MVRPWSILIVSQSDQQIIGQELVVQEPGPDLLFDHLARAMRKPSAGKPHRPSEIQVRDEPVWNAVQPCLQEIGVDCIFRSDLEEADFVAGEMQKLMRPEGQPPALVESKNFNSAQGARFYAAAAEYFRGTPWRRVPADALIQVDCPQLGEFSSGRWYAVVLGQAGQTLGLALYSDRGAIAKMCGGGCGSDLGISGGTAISMLFSEAFEVPVADMLAAEQHHWESAGPEAYPLVLCSNGGVDIRQIEPWEFQLLEDCVRTIPDFVKQHPYSSGSDSNAGLDSPAVPAASSNLKFMLSWLDLDEGDCGSDCDHCED
jgi:hypothetical protein